MRKICLLYCLSGLLSLGYQVAWFRIFVDRFGSTNFTFALVLCNFIGGLGLGALLSARLTRGMSRRLGIDDPLRVYGLVEILIAIAVLLTPLTGLIPAETWGVFPYVLEGAVHRPVLTYKLGTAAIAVACVFVPCFLMGMTFPLLCQAFAARWRFPSRLYAYNTLGACTGVLLCEYLLLPTIGHVWALFMLVAVNAILGTYFLLGRGGRAETPDLLATRSARVTTRPDSTRPATPIALSALIAVAIVSGFLTGTIEADVFQRLRFLGCDADAAMSFISFWAILGIFLASWTVRSRPNLSFDHVKIAAVAGVVLFAGAWKLGFTVLDELVMPHFGISLTGILILTALFVFPSMYLISLLLPFACNRIQAQGRHLGVAYGCNTLAFCLGMLAFTWWAPAVNIFYALKLSLVVAIVMVGLLLVLRASESLPLWKLAAAAVVLLAGVFFTLGGFDTNFFRDGSPAATFPVRAMKSNAANTTFIVEEPLGDCLYFTHHRMSAATPGAETYMRLMAHVPLLAQDDPTDALLICFGVGNTASAIGAHDSIERFDIVDLNDKVFETAPEFAMTNRRVYLDPRIRFINDDGRSFLGRTDRRYNLVTSEPPPPRHPGVYRLYSREYYESVIEHLTPNGMMTQWLPVNQLSREAVELMVTTFTDAFPHTMLFIGHQREFILLGSPSPIDLARIEERFDDSLTVRADLNRVGINRPVQLLARFVQGDATLRDSWGDRVISDHRNDLSGPLLALPDPPTIVFDPLRLLEEIGADRFASRDELTATLTDLSALRTAIPDFPLASLASVAVTCPEARFAGARWSRLDALRRAANKAQSRGDIEEARTLLEQCLEIVPDHALVLDDLGRAFGNAGDLERALAVYRRYAELRPESPRPHLGVGQTLLGLGHADEAIIHLEHAVELSPGWYIAHRFLGDALAAVGRTDELHGAYEQAVVLNPWDARSNMGRDMTAAQAMVGDE